MYCIVSLADNKIIPVPDSSRTKHTTVALSAFALIVRKSVARCKHKLNYHETGNYTFMIHFTSTRTAVAKTWSEKYITIN